ncbi:MAG TPA: hypothetical protein VHT75_19985 [Acidimicrobiales bacterium]|nr:hypothetical protein [Acidimicrobiales bacterium]
MGSAAAPPATVDVADVMREIQGNILRAYGRQYVAVRHLVLRIGDARAARRGLAALIDGDRGTPDVTTGERPPRELNFRWCLNIGFTYRGLGAIGVPESSLGTFPAEFRLGMVARAGRLGDVGDSAPQNWIEGFADDRNVHVIVTIHGCSLADIERVSGQVLGIEGGSAWSPVVAEPLDGEAMIDPATNQRLVHFGYADGISQPRFLGVHDPEEINDPLPFAPLGTILLGHTSSLPHVTWTVPDPSVLGRNGTFNAFRVLAQDVDGFEDFLAEQQRQYGADPEETAAKLCGRWRRSGVPLSLAPTAADAAAFNDPGRLNDFDYVDNDPDGEVCPIGAHIRRANPRGAHIVQRGSNRTRALIRRGIPYGPPFDPELPGSRETPRGLLGNFLCANLAAQFESMQYDWINLGLQDPRITGSNDPLIGANDPAFSRFTWPQSGAPPRTLRGLPRFVTTRGGAYTFLPSIPALRWIAACGAAMG